MSSGRVDASTRQRREPGKHGGPVGAYRDVLHSTADRVLEWAFPPGQLAGEPGVGAPWPEAVGRHGRPAQAWTTDQGLRIGHGEYWDNPETARRLLHHLGVIVTPDVPPERTLAERALPEREFASASPSSP